MLKIERVKAALRGELVDRPPVSLWMEHPSADQDPAKLACTHVAFQEKYDLDFIKLTPFDLYCVPDWGGELSYDPTGRRAPQVARRAVGKAGDWMNLRPLSGVDGVWGKQLEALRCVKALANPDVPVLQTVYSPLSVARKLAGDRLREDLREYPQLVHKALEVITATTLGFVRQTLQDGAAGIFFATTCANFDFVSEAEYATFGRRYDLEVLKAAESGWFNTLHIHGRKIFFDELLDYPVQALNWHDCHEYPPVRRARSMTDKCIIGGVDEEGAIVSGKAYDVIEEVSYFLQETEVRGVMVGPGCATVAPPPENNVTALRLVVERYADKDLWKYLSLDHSYL